MYDQPNAERLIFTDNYIQAIKERARTSNPRSIRQTISPIAPGRLRCTPKGAAYASRSHFAKKLFFAAPVRALPLLSTAFGSHALRLRVVRKLFLAAPTSALPCPRKSVAPSLRQAAQTRRLPSLLEVLSWG